MGRVKIVQGDTKGFTLVFYDNRGNLKDLTNLSVKLDISIEGSVVTTINGSIKDQTLFPGEGIITIDSNSLDALTDSYGTLQGEPYLVDGSSNTDRDYDFIWIDVRKPLSQL